MCWFRPEFVLKNQEKMKFVIFYFLLASFVIVQSHEFKGFTLKFLYQVFTGDFINLKRKEKVEKSVLRNDTSSYLGKFGRYEKS